MVVMSHGKLVIIILITITLLIINNIKLNNNVKYYEKNLLEN